MGGRFILLAVCWAALAVPASARPEPRPPPRDLDLAPVFPPGTEPLPIDLPTVLRLSDAANPTVAIARKRVEEAQAFLELTQLYWLPNLQVGAVYQRHDGQIQNSAGLVFNSNRSSLFVSGAAVMRVDTADAYFAPLIARRLTSAEAATARAVGNNVQLEAALAYYDLVLWYGSLAVNADTLARIQVMLNRAEAAARAGASKTTADVPRARTEYNLRLRERAELRERVGLASARLARLLLLRPTVALVPAETAVVPVRLVPDETPLDDLVMTGLTNRPEVRATREQAAAALTRWQQVRVTPFVPRLQLEYAAGDFGGGPKSSFENFNARGDGTAGLVWEWRNLGLGEQARLRQQRAVVEEANLRSVDVESRVAEDVAAAVYQVRARREGFGFTQEAVRQALEMWDRLERAQFGMAGPRGQYDALEPLLAIQALAQARSQYLSEVIDYNRGQLRLYTALGQPALEALPGAVPVPVQVPPTPPAFQPRPPR